MIRQSKNIARSLVPRTIVSLILFLILPDKILAQFQPRDQLRRIHWGSSNEKVPLRIDSISEHGGAIVYADQETRELVTSLEERGYVRFHAYPHGYSWGLTSKAGMSHAITWPTNDETTIVITRNKVDPPVGTLAILFVYSETWGVQTSGGLILQIKDDSMHVPGFWEYGEGTINFFDTYFSEPELHKRPQKSK